MAKPTCVACKGAGGGVSEDKVQNMIDTSIESKQDVLTAGTGINIVNNTISATFDGITKKLVTSQNWLSDLLNYVDGNYYTKYNLEFWLDLGSTNANGSYFIAKGTQVSYQGSIISASSKAHILFISYTSPDVYIRSWDASWEQIFTNDANMNMSYRQIKIPTTGSSIVVGNVETKSFPKYPDKESTLGGQIRCYYWDD